MCIRDSIKGLVTILTVGAWYVLRGQTQIGTIVAFVSGLRNINDPWGDLVGWFQNLMVTLTKYDLIASSARMMAAPRLEKSVV